MAWPPGGRATSGSQAAKKPQPARQPGGWVKARQPAAMLSACPPAPLPACPPARRPACSPARLLAWPACTGQTSNQAALHGCSRCLALPSDVLHQIG